MTPSTARRISAGPHSQAVIGEGLLDEVPTALGALCAKVLVVHTASVGDHAERIAGRISGTGRTAYLHLVPDAEAAKTPEVAAQAWAALGRADFTRSDEVIGVGGGAVTDLAGFIGATWLRGVAVTLVPTTLLGMVDAAVGGKTGINTDAGKNLVGAFHLPRTTWCDLTTLATLPRADFVAGMAEVVKAGFIADPVIVDLVEAHPQVAPGDDVLAELVFRAISVKAEVVVADLREALLREILNYGHTLAHAIEVTEGYTRRHGEAVSIGMMYAGRLGELLGRTPAELVARQYAVLAGLGLPVTYPAGHWDELLAAMRRDKKSRGALLRFVVLDGLGRPGRAEGPAEDVLRAAYDAITGV